MNERYYFNTGFTSEVIDEVYQNKEEYIWWTGINNDQFQVKDFDEDLIQKDTLLSYLHPLLNGKLKLFKFPSMTYYRWHTDDENLFNLNLTLKKQNSYVMFRSQEGDYDIGDTHNVLHAITPLDYEPRIWYLFDAQIPHTIFNFDQETRYLLTYNVFKGSEISYQEAIDIIKDFKNK